MSRPPKKPPLPADDPQHQARADWETSDEKRRVKAIIEEAERRVGPKELLPHLRKLNASFPSTPNHPITRAIARLEQEQRREGARLTAEKKRSKAGYAPPEVVAEVVATVDRLAPNQSSRVRFNAIRAALSRRGAGFPLNGFARWVTRSLRIFSEPS
jgi:hypothetical protein